MNAGRVPTRSARSASARMWLRRLAWMACFWVAGVATLGVIAYAFRAAMSWVGLAP